MFSAPLVAMDAGVTSLEDREQVLRMHTLFKSAIPLLGIYHKETLPVLQKGLTMRLFVIIYSTMMKNQEAASRASLYNGIQQ